MEKDKIQGSASPTVTTTVRIPVVLREQLEEIAKKETRSLNAQIIVALKEHIKNYNS